jgi:hypothetical protein
LFPIDGLQEDGRDHDYDVEKARIMACKTKKFDCPARVELREVLRFPDNKVGMRFIGFMDLIVDVISNKCLLVDEN